MEWIAYAMVGITVGFVAACMTQVEHHIIYYRKAYADAFIGGEESQLLMGFAYFASISMLCVLVGSAVTVYYGPGAYGSGIPEIISYLNGVNYPSVIGFQTFVTKIFSNVLAVSGGLCIGKEGPLAHIGANVGVIIAYLPIPYFLALRNDKNKRHLIAAGTSAGVAAAFGAPVGGALFTFELSKPANFWTFTVTWKVFMSCATSVFSLAICHDLMMYGEVKSVSASALAFHGSAELTAATVTTLPFCLLNGIICGVLGALFVKINCAICVWRKKFITKKWIKPLEAVIFVLLTVTIFFWLPNFYRVCRDHDDVS